MLGSPHADMQALCAGDRNAMDIKEKLQEIPGIWSDELWQGIRDRDGGFWRPQLWRLRAALPCAALKLIVAD